MLDPVDDTALGRWFDGLVDWDGGRPDVVAAPARTVAYGPDPNQVADLWLPEGVADPPVLVSIHGGYFQESYLRDLHRPVVRDLVHRGFAVWNLEYRRAGSGGGLHETTSDVWSAIDVLGSELGAGPRSLAVFGHSAGGYLSEWVAPHPRVDLVVPVAAVLDLPGVVHAGWDGGAIVDWLRSTPEEDPALYAAGELTRRLPADVDRVLLHGTEDTTVGISQSRAFARAARAAGDPTELVELPGEGHYGFIDPRGAAFLVLCEVLDRWRRGKWPPSIERGP